MLSTCTNGRSVDGRHYQMPAVTKCTGKNPSDRLTGFTLKMATNWKKED